MTATEQVASICQECGAPVGFELGAEQVRCDHCEAGFVVAEGARLVRLGCPRCGGNFYYLDGSMAGDCPYCRAHLLAVSERQVLRYAVRPRTGAPQEAPGARLQLLPFWHLGALMYGWLFAARSADRVDLKTTMSRSFAGRVIDLTIPDPAAQAHGVRSLRFRSSVFPLEPFAAEHEALGELVHETLTINAASDELFTRAMGLTRPTGDQAIVRVQRRDLAAESLALIYYPFWIAPDSGEAWDAVSGEPESLAARTEAPLGTASDLFDSFRVLELACPACGEELIAGNRAVVLPCSGCDHFWQVTPRGLEGFEARFARPAVGGQAEGELQWLPFWRVSAEIIYKARKLERAEQITGALGVPLPEGQGMASPAAPPCYYAPAYGAMLAPRVEHAARDMTRAQQVLEPSAAPGGSGRELFHCFFSAQDAQSLAYATWLALLPSLTVQELRTLRIRPGEAELWYVPFQRQGRELVNLLSGGAYDVSTFSGVRH